MNMGGPGRSSMEIMIPGPKVGLIIGKGGETIKQLQEKSGAKMVVIQDGPNQEHEKPLVISGDPAKIEHAKQLVYDLIAEKEMKSFNRRGGGGGPRYDNRQQEQYNEFGGNGGGGNEQEVGYLLTTFCLLWFNGNGIKSADCSAFSGPTGISLETYKGSITPPKNVFHQITKNTSS